MAEACSGARVHYCGHNGWFVADIYLVGNVNVVRADGPIEGWLRRPADGCTHRVVDFPTRGFWRPDLGILVVPQEQVVKL